MNLRVTERQYQTPNRELARQLQERDREGLANLRSVWSETDRVTTRVGGIWIFPEDYGAVRDGRHDDTQALQLTINAAEADGLVVWLSAGTYLITRPLLIATGGCKISGHRSSVLKMDATLGGGSGNLSMVLISGDSVRIEGIVVAGDNTGLGGLTTGSTGGHGIVLNAATNIEIDDVEFRDIGVQDADPVDDVWASPIAGVDTSGISVTRCLFTETCENHTGADVLVGGQDTRIEECRSVSFCDAFASLGGDAGSIRHIVRNNFAVRTEEAISRSGVLAAYAADVPTFADISHNHLEGFKWHGIYANASLGADAGAAIIAHNTIRHCGGMDNITVDPPVPWPGAGIKLYGRGGAVIEGNNVYGSGYSSEFDARDTVAPGITVLGNSTNQTISNNLIRRCSGNGITLATLGSTADDIVESVTIANNTIDANDAHGIELAANTTNLGTLSDVMVIGNTVRVTSATAYGIALTAANGGWAHHIDFIGNKIVHLDPPSSGSVAGIFRATASSDNTRNTGIVQGNTVIGFRTGIDVTYGNGVPLYVPRAVIVDGNRIEDCFLGYTIGNAANAWGVFSNSSGYTSSGGTFSNSRSRPGRIVGIRVNGTPRVEFLYDGSPPDGNWEVGDRVMRENITGTTIGYLCTTAGAPGTWTALTT